MFKAFVRAPCLYTFVILHSKRQKILSGSWLLPCHGLLHRRASSFITNNNNNKMNVHNDGDRIGKRVDYAIRRQPSPPEVCCCIIIINFSSILCSEIEALIQKQKKQKTLFLSFLHETETNWRTISKRKLLRTRTFFFSFPTTSQESSWWAAHGARRNIRLEKVW